jgi:hypothetical protein
LKTSPIYKIVTSLIDDEDLTESLNANWSSSTAEGTCMLKYLPYKQQMKVSFEYGKQQVTEYYKIHNLNNGEYFGRSRSILGFFLWKMIISKNQITRGRYQFFIEKKYFIGMSKKKLGRPRKKPKIDKEKILKNLTGILTKRKRSPRNIANVSTFNIPDSDPSHSEFK